MATTTHGMGSQSCGIVGQSGFSLIEVIVATIISVIAILGLAHSFGIGRGLINRFAADRNALAAVEARVETLSRLPLSSPDLTLGAHTGSAIELYPGLHVQETWTVTAVDDPADGVGGADQNPVDYKSVTVALSWNAGGFPETIQLSRTFLNP